MPQRKERPGILVVSRDPKLASLGKRVLKNAGFAVIPATNLREVTAACARNSIRVAMIGHSLRPAEKRRIANAIRESCRVPVLQLHANEDPELLKSTYSYSHHAESERFIETIRSIVSELNQAN